jgi:hypothetical protein
VRDYDVRLVTWAKATRRISLGAPGPAWSQFLHEIESLVDGEGFGVQLSGPAGSEAMTDRVGEVVSRGYSLRSHGRSDPVELVTRPSGVLYIVSPFGTADDIASWISHVPARHFRQYLLALDAFEEEFGRLASACAGESWHLDSFVPPGARAEFVVEFIGSREIDLVQVVNARLGADLVPTLRSAYPSVRVVADVDGKSESGRVWLAYLTSRYGNVVDAFFAWQRNDIARLEAALVPPTRIVHLGTDHEDRDKAAAALHEELYGRLIAELAG